MLKKIFVSLCLLIIFASCNINTDKLEIYCDYNSQNCDKKVVNIEATPPEHILQHPIISFDKHEYYYETDIGQIIFISENKIQCPSKIQIVGKYESNVGPCNKKSNTKDMYCGVAIYVSEWSCK